MQHGFIKVAACTPKIRVAAPQYNGDRIIEQAREAAGEGAKIIVFPELCITAYTCQDLFYQETLLESAKEQLVRIADETDSLDALLFVGLPIEKNQKLYNVAAAIQNGKILGFVPKSFLPNYNEFYEIRQFTPGDDSYDEIKIEGDSVPFSRNLLFQCEDKPDLVIGCEICEDLWVANPPSTFLAEGGANIIVNLSASNETVGKAAYRRMLVAATSARLLVGYIYASAGEGESTQDIVFGGHNLIGENGTILGENKPFHNGIVYGDIDIARLREERRRTNTFQIRDAGCLVRVPFTLEIENTDLMRAFERMPFVPQNEQERQERCEEILSIQSYGLKKRYEHIGCRKAVIGISGGLDSTLALLVTVKAFDSLKIPRENIIAVTMPCFGTTDRTYDNACRLTRTLGATLKEVDIKEAVSLHFRDIGHDPAVHDVTYENGQARERTQVLMNIANQNNALVIGTGDMSELALGWATYNGDHMSMYGVNAGVPKTLVRHLVRFYADTCEQGDLSEVLLDVLDTPVSPELLPPVDGVISQKTEDLVGPYELHDFFLYYMLRFGFAPDKIYRIACRSFEGEFAPEFILKWMKTFYRRFFAQHFKRSCLPDGPKVGSVAVSPRGDLRMPSDACATVWMAQLETIV